MTPNNEELKSLAEFVHYPPCDKWEDGIKAVNGPIHLQSMRSGGGYQFDQKFTFNYCPWCGEKLVKVNAVEQATKGVK